MGRDRREGLRTMMGIWPSMPRLPRSGDLVRALGVGMVVSACFGAGPERVPQQKLTGHRAPAIFLARKVVKRQEFGRGARSYWLFEPAEPTPESAPVVVFHHGWLAVNPAAYGAWIEHLVRSGQVVIFPRYQADGFTRPADFLPNALAAVRDALDVLETSPGHVRPDRRRFALIGHSAGGQPRGADGGGGRREPGCPRPAP